MKTTPKDFFLNLGAIVTLYVSIVSLLNLAFSVISASFPAYEIYDYGRVYSISWPVATLIIVFPIFVFLGWLLQRDMGLNPEKKALGIRRWLIYITLFLAGIAFATDLVILLYTFLNGEIITTGFLLKVLAVLIVTASVFSYYILELVGRMTHNMRKMYVVISAVVILGMIIAGFTIIGSPRTQRLTRVDADRVSDLQNIQWQIVNYWQQKQTLPQNLAALQDSVSGYYAPGDPQTGEPYEYRVLGSLKFELCAVFALKNNNPAAYPYLESRARSAVEDREISKNNSWTHPAGRFCFERTIDPDFYPPARTKQIVQ